MCWAAAAALDFGDRRYDQHNVFGDFYFGVSVARRRFTAVSAASSMSRWSDLVPHGGGAVAILIASIAMAVIAGMIALELQRNMFGWMVTVFVVTFVVVSAAVYALG
jgi:hypothetical protein